VGGITETDVNLASASNAIIIGFNVRPVPKAQTLAEMETSHGLIGHTHIAEYYVQAEGQILVEKRALLSGEEIDLVAGRRYLINSGSVGQPRDGNPQGSCGLWEEDAARLTVYRFDYEMEKTQQKMLAAGLPDYLSQRLAVGR
jgi:hypothetical protein